MKHTPIRKTVDLDALYANRPDTRPAMRWPVGQIVGHQMQVTWFDSWSDAADFAMHNNGYMGEPEYSLTQPDPLGEPEMCGDCGEPATELHHGDAFCRDCWNELNGQFGVGA
jgi:hypothetical protein